MMLYALDHELFQAFSILSPPVNLVQVDLNCTYQKNTFPEVVWLLLLIFLAKSNLALFAHCGEPSVLLIVDFDSDTPTFWRVFVPWLDVVKGFFFTMERIIILCCRAHYSVFFFLRMYQTCATPNVPAISLIDLFWF